MEIPFDKSMTRFCRELVLQSRTRRLLRPVTCGGNRFSVVACAYNVARYLPDFLKSLTQQTLDFSRHVELIVVDDGSTDESAAIICQWQKQYPDSIRYIHQANAGLNAARNAGLMAATAPWVTFIDPDDLVHCRYFEHVDAFLTGLDRSELAKLKVVSCNFIFFHERSAKISDTHPLRHRYSKPASLLPTTSRDALQLGVNHAFMNRDLLADGGMLFDERRWGTFDDAHLMARFLNDGLEGSIAYLRAPEYYYRRREAQDSNMDRSHYRPETYTRVLREACLELFADFERSTGQIPFTAQWIVAYHLGWILHRQFKGFDLSSVLTDPAHWQEFMDISSTLLQKTDDAVLAHQPPSLARHFALLREAKTKGPAFLFQPSDRSH